MNAIVAVTGMLPATSLSEAAQVLLETLFQAGNAND